MSFPEHDWKRLRALLPGKTAAGYEQVLAEIEAMLTDRKGREVDVFNELYDRLREDRQSLRIMFSDVRRSQLGIMLLTWRSRGLLSDEELASFSDEARQFIEQATRRG